MAERAKSENERDGLPMLSPNDHARMLVELLQPMGAELARRWVAGLLMVPREERERVVDAVVGRIVEVYAEEAGEDVCFDIAGEVVQKEGYVEQTIRTYAAGKKAGTKGKRAGKQAGKQAGSRGQEESA